MPEDFVGWLSLVGAFCFGIVIGWVTYRALRFSTNKALSDIATVIGAVGGAAVTGLFPKETGTFGGYCIGLFIGFFAYLRTAQDPAAPPWLGGPSRPATARDWSLPWTSPLHPSPMQLRSDS